MRNEEKRMGKTGIWVLYQPAVPCCCPAEAASLSTAFHFGRPRSANRRGKRVRSPHRIAGEVNAAGSASGVCLFSYHADMERVSRRAVVFSRAWHPGLVVQCPLGACGPARRARGGESPGIERVQERATPLLLPGATITRWRSWQRCDDLKSSAF